MQDTKAQSDDTVEKSQVHTLDNMKTEIQEIEEASPAAAAEQVEAKRNSIEL